MNYTLMVREATEEIKASKELITFVLDGVLVGVHPDHEGQLWVLSGERF